MQAGEIRIEPWNPDTVGPCSVDLTLDSVFRVYNLGEAVDIRSTLPVDRDTRVVMTGERPFTILPGQFILGQTRERISVSSRYAGILEGKSSVARLGIIVHAAGLVNPGTGVRKPSHLVLEIFCENVSPVLLYPGMSIVQAMFFRLSSPASKGYDERDTSHFVGQDEPRVT